MSKSKESLLKVAATSKAKGDKLWAQAKQAEQDGDPGKATNLFQSARMHYDTSKRAKKSASNT